MRIHLGLMHPILPFDFFACNAEETIPPCCYVRGPPVSGNSPCGCGKGRKSGGVAVAVAVPSPQRFGRSVRKGSSRNQSGPTHPHEETSNSGWNWRQSDGQTKRC